MQSKVPDAWPFTGPSVQGPQGLASRSSLGILQSIELGVGAWKKSAGLLQLGASLISE
jgi:hypothetical protein